MIAVWVGVTKVKRSLSMFVIPLIRMGHNYTTRCRYRFWYCSIILNAYLNWSIDDLIDLSWLLTICFLVIVLHSLFLCNNLAVVVLYLVDMIWLVLTLWHWMFKTDRFSPVNLILFFLSPWGIFNLLEERLMHLIVNGYWLSRFVY